MIRYLKINIKDYLNKNKLNKMFPTKYVSYFNFLLRYKFEKNLHNRHNYKYKNSSYNKHLSLIFIKDNTRI